MFAHDARDGFPDRREAAAAREEGGDGDFVGGVEHGGEGAAGFAGFAGEGEGGEIGEARGLEVEPGEFGEVERREGIRHALGVGDGVLDGEAHVGGRELREHRAVDELDHGMHDGLRMDDDFHAGHLDIEKPAGLDHFEAFVEERGGVDGDLRAHRPGGMFQRLLDGHAGELRGGHLAKRAAAGGEDQPPDGGKG